MDRLTVRKTLSELAFAKVDFTLRDVVAEARAYLWIAGLAFVFGFIFLLVELLSADLVIWNGRCVPAFFDGGVAHYTVAGQKFFADNPPLPNRSPRMVTVCYYPSDPGNGYIVHPSAYWVEGGLVAGPFGVALVLVILGILRSVRRLREPPSLPPLPTFREPSG